MLRHSLIQTMVQAITVLTVLKMMAKAQTCGQGGIGRIMYERIPNYQLQGFDDEIIRDTLPPLNVLEKCQDFCLRDRSSANVNMARACSSFDFQPGNRINSFNGNNPEYEESNCYLTQEQAEPEGIGHLMYVPNSVHFSEICIISNRPDRECPRSRYVFERHPRKKLEMTHSELKEIKANNRSDCANKCLNEFTFVCRSASFDFSKGMCLISRFTRRTHPELLKDNANSEYLENTCLNYERRCDGFFAFIMEKNKKLAGPFEVDVSKNVTLEQCKEKCIHADSYFCRSIEYDETTQECIISEEDSVSQKDDLISSNSKHHFYDLICLENPKFGYEYPENSVTSHLFSNRRLPDTAFQRYRNSRLGTEFHSEITGKTLSECLDECLRHSSFQCHSVVYSDRFRTCRLSRHDQKNGMRIIYDADYDYYENLMLNTANDDEHKRPTINRRPTFEDDRKIPARYPLDSFNDERRRYPYDDNDDDRIPFGWRSTQSPLSDNNNNNNRRRPFNDDEDYRNRRPFNDDEDYRNRRPNPLNDIDSQIKYYDADPFDFRRFREYDRRPNNRNRYYNDNKDNNQYFYDTPNRNFRPFNNYDLQDLPLRDKHPIFSNERNLAPLYYDFPKPYDDRARNFEQDLRHHTTPPVPNYFTVRNNKYYSEDVRFLGNNKWVSTSQNDYDDYVRPNVIGPTSSHCNNRKDTFKLMATNKKIRKSFIRRYLNTNSMLSCQQECLEARDFICKSFNYREHDIGLENCELSDQSFKDPNYNSLDFFDPGIGINYYERVDEFNDDPDDECLDVSQTCNEHGMEFILRTNDPFYGRLYSYGFYDRCFFNANGGTKNVLKISGPGIYPECGTQRFGDIITNIVVVQYNDHVQTGKDKRYNLTCFMNGPSEAVVRSGYIGAASSGPAPIEYLQARNSLSSKIKMKIYYNGRETTTIAVGDPLTLRIYSENIEDDIFASSVIARDPHTGRSVTLIDKGCPVNRKVFPEMNKQRDNDGLEASFYGFKLPESNFLIFEANVYTCKTVCQPAYCPPTQLDRLYNRRKKRNSASKFNKFYAGEQNEKISELVAVFKSRHDLQQEAAQASRFSDMKNEISGTCFEYSGLIIGIVIAVFLMSIFSIIIGFAYRKNKQLKSKQLTTNNDCKSTITTIFGSIQKPYNYNENLFKDPSEPIYTDPSLFEQPGVQFRHDKCSYP